jgi:hypothetical protein
MICKFNFDLFTQGYLYKHIIIDFFLCVKRWRYINVIDIIMRIPWKIYYRWYILLEMGFSLHLTSKVMWHCSEISILANKSSIIYNIYTYSSHIFCSEKFWLAWASHISRYSQLFHLQAPYLLYVEVLEVEHLHTSQVQGKILENTLRYTRSEEDLASLASRTTGSPHPEFSVFGNFVHCELDDAECWSQEDDEIIQVVVKFIL